MIAPPAREGWSRLAANSPSKQEGEHRADCTNLGAYRQQFRRPQGGPGTVVAAHCFRRLLRALFCDVLAAGALFVLPPSQLMSPRMHCSTSSMSQGMWMCLFLFYLVNYFVVVFFNVALVSAASSRLAGGHDHQRRTGSGMAAQGQDFPVGPLLRYGGHRFADD